MKAHAITLAAILAITLGSADAAKLENVFATRPNVIFLMDDQHRWDALGLVNPAVITPHLDD